MLTRQINAGIYYSAILGVRALIFPFLFQQFNWTDGCIALTNRDMDDFMEKVDVGTPIEIQW